MASPRETLGLTAASVALAVLLAEVYTRTAALTGLTDWVAAAAVNTGLAAVVAAISAAAPGSRVASERDAGPFPSPAWQRTTAWLGGAPWRSYLPALCILAGTALLATLSRLLGGAPPSTGAAPPLAWILWIPLVEELVFRAGIGRLFRRLTHSSWAAWFSALTFAFVHASPTVARLAAGRVGLPLGPFLLGLACEALLAATGRLLPCIALHAACNATAAVFANGDARWLDWLGFLYS